MSDAKLTPREIKLYAQQIKLPAIGLNGQEKLKNARVLCVGAGGLGTPLLLYLASAGVGTIGIVDDDVVELSNLPRQILYREQHLGMAKVAIAAEEMQTINSSIVVHAHHTRLDINNAESLIKQYDIIADCSDNFSTRYLVNDACFKLQKPYVSASILKFAGQCITFLGTEGPCYRCLFPEQSQNHANLSCEEGGVLGIVPGLFGIIQATEMIKWIVNQGDLLAGRVLTVDLLTMQFKEFYLDQNPDCDLYIHHRMIAPEKNKKQCLEKKITMNEYLISAEELAESLKEDQTIQLIDVRTPEKHEAYNIGGKLIPYDDLINRLDELDGNKLIVTYCTSGGRSMMALKLLLDAGFTFVKSLDGGVTAWREQGLT